MIRPIHPFPARMAPSIAIAGLEKLKAKSLVLDPMTGSGTVVRHASELGHQAIAFDVDPLAVLITKVWTTPVDDAVVARLTTDVLNNVRNVSDAVELPWIDGDEKTNQFVKFWFANPQRSDLRRLSYVLSQLDPAYLQPNKRAAYNVLRLALSRIIITKNQGASLARDVSHSRPHKVAESSNYEVIFAFERSVRQIRRLLAGSPPVGNVSVRLGDARCMKLIGDSEVDAVLTSPPYLNAIDYMRGHRLSLVWLGYNLPSLKNIRSNSIGAERGSETTWPTHPCIDSLKKVIGEIDKLPHRYASVVMRYIEDVYGLMSEVARVLKPEGKAVFVIGNSCLKGIFIQNSEVLIKAASMVGLRLLHRVERELPTGNRYLPMPADKKKPLGKRIRTENILTFIRERG